MKRFIALFATVLLVPTLVAASETSAGGPKAAAKVIDPKAATLTEAIGDWVALLELDYPLAPDRAAERWAKDEAAAKALKENWRALVERHGKFDYHNWVTGDRSPSATHLATDATSFTVGGHEYGHLHVRWVKTDNGWRIGNVFFCR